MLDDVRSPSDLFQKLSANIDKKDIGTHIRLMKQTLLYDDIAQLGHESAGSFKEVRKSVLLFLALEKEYGEKAKAQSIDAIMQEIIEYAESQTRNTDPLQAEVAQTALRALLTPAPLTGEHPNYFLASSPNLFGAGSSFHAREMLSLFWLAASDPNIETNMPQEEANIAEKNLILRILAEIRRANNISYFHCPEDDKEDKLSCGPGVITRLGNSFNYNEKLRALKEQLYSFIEDFPFKFNAFLINHFRTFSATHQWRTILAIYQIIQDEEVTFEEYSAFMQSFLSEAVFVQYVEMLQAEHGAFDENLFKYSIIIYFEEWLKNKHRMSLGVIRNLEKSAKEAICLTTCQATVESFSESSLESQLNDMQDVLSTIEDLQRQHKTLTIFDLNLLSNFHQQYKVLTHRFYAILDGVGNIVKQRAQTNLERIGHGFVLSTTCVKIDWLPISVKKLLHKQALLHQQMMELLHSRLLSLYEYEQYAETLINPMMLLGFEGKMLSFDKVNLVKTFLYRHSQTPEALGLEKHLSPTCCLEMRKVKDNVRIYFTDLPSLTSTFYDVSTADFDSMAKKEISSQQIAPPKEVKHQENNRALLRLS